MLEAVDAPSLPGARIAAGAKYQRARVQIAFPFENMGCNLQALAATVCGNLFELKKLSGCRLMNLELPREFAARFLGPQFGVEGRRKLTGVWNRPMLGTIIKPSVGLSP